MAYRILTQEKEGDPYVLDPQRYEGDRSQDAYAKAREMGHATGIRVWVLDEEDVRMTAAVCRTSRAQIIKKNICPTCGRHDTDLSIPACTCINCTADRLIRDEFRILRQNARRDDNPADETEKVEQ